ncbi:hypothetical protein QYZ44_26825 [Vibrio parahaemolyticus]|nr:hypothetical protein [Vibrio parahaemolyticus]MDN4712332.1 hypothetical protein [Vibrio parahaemolyticus]
MRLKLLAVAINSVIYSDRKAQLDNEIRSGFNKLNGLMMRRDVLLKRQKPGTLGK